ncbi:major allergen Asp F2 [Immersiella caudata]|uniref:Major allergen Asp F2 n=1 Tax=Immersiella caudata TaxID=314043 RepID=A0AA40BU81_9PEZI|nr:major allergen Asp F2 [Immersiella caudata]
MQCLLFLTLLFSTALGRPTSSSRLPSSIYSPPSYSYLSEFKSPFPIHSSCNATAYRVLSSALWETVTMARTAKEYLLDVGNQSPIFQKYFGATGQTAVPIGIYERIIEANHDVMLFRCDDPDQNCATQEGWAGHWRGINATSETVICPLSFAKRLPLPQLCLNNYTVKNSPLNTFWATDLLHRLLHIPNISENVVDHFASGYDGVLKLAKVSPEKAVIDSDAIQYFALEVFALFYGAPGTGCLGE